MIHYFPRISSQQQPLVPIAEIAVDRLSLTLGDLLHEGTFGRIYQVNYVFYYYIYYIVYFLIFIFLLLTYSFLLFVF